MRDRWQSRLAQIDRLDRAVTAVVAILAVVTLVLVAFPSLDSHVVAPAFDLALDTIAAVVSGSVAVLAWVRSRERQDSGALYQAAAFTVLLIAYARAVAVSVASDGVDGGSLAEPENVQLYVFAIARVLAAGLLVVGGFSSNDRPARSAPWAVVVASAAVMVAAIGAVTLTVESLPPLLVLDHRRVGPLAVLPDVSPLGIAVQLLVAALFVGAAVACRRLWRRNHTIGDAYIALGLIVAAFGEIQWAIYPSNHPGQVASGDLLRLIFFIGLLLAVEAEARSLMSALRRANDGMERLRIAEVERAALEERARLARELHDGLAQDLWLAKLKIGRLAGVTTLGPDERMLTREAGEAIDVGLADARQAVMALRIASDTEDSLCDLLSRYIDDFQDRFGLPVEFACARSLPVLSIRTQAELLRIAQEALSNVHRHASASVVRVALRVEGDHLALVVADDGRGFDAAATRDAFGLVSMRERAALIHGRLVIESCPGEGTTVHLSVPLAVAVAGAKS